MLNTQVVMLHLPDSKFVATNSPDNKEGSFISQYYTHFRNLLTSSNPCIMSIANAHHAEH
jgi:hypothetical protein